MGHNELNKPEAAVFSARCKELCLTNILISFQLMFPYSVVPKTIYTKSLVVLCLVMYLFLSTKQTFFSIILCKNYGVLIVCKWWIKSDCLYYYFIILLKSQLFHNFRFFLALSFNFYKVRLPAYFVIVSLNQNNIRYKENPWNLK